MSVVRSAPHGNLTAADGPTLRPAAVEFHYTQTDSFVALLQQLGASLMVSTYQANKLLVARAAGGGLSMLVRTFEQLQALEKSQPFKEIAVTENTRLYVTFIARAPKGAITIPYISPDKSLRILSASKTEVCMVLTLSLSVDTSKAMEIVEKEWGKGVTTRNWNTVQKLLALKKR